MKNYCFRMRIVIPIITFLLFGLLTGCVNVSENISELSVASSASLSSNTSEVQETKYYQNQYVSELGSSISFGVTKPINLYEPGEEIEYYFKLTGDAYTLGKATVTFYNKALKISESREHTFAVGSKNPVTGKFSAQLNGVYKLKLEIPDTNRTLYFSIGIYPRAERIANDSFYYGIQAYVADVFGSQRSVANREGYKVLWETIDWLGCNLIRDGASWWSMQGDEEAAVSFNLMDTVVNDAEKRGITINWCMVGTPEWAVAEEYQAEPVAWNKPPVQEYWENYLSEVVKHYKDHDSILYEIWNEPDWEFWDGTIEEYLTFLERSAVLIKSIKPDAYVFPGGMVSNYDLSNVAGKDSAVYYRKYKELLDNGLIDNYAVHIHGSFDDQWFFDTVDRIDGLIRPAGLAPEGSFMNEAGTWNPSDSGQAEELIGKILWTRANGYGMYVAYTYRGFAGQASRDWFEMMSSTLEPRESYIAYAHLIHTLGQAEYVEKIVNQKTVYADIYRDGNRYIVPVYASVDGGKSLEIKSGTAYKAYDLFGNPLTISQNQVEVGESVVYLEFENPISAEDFIVH